MFHQDKTMDIASEVIKEAGATLDDVFTAFSAAANSRPTCLTCLLNNNISFCIT